MHFLVDWRSKRECIWKGENEEKQGKRNLDVLLLKRKVLIGHPTLLEFYAFVLFFLCFLF